MAGRAPPLPPGLARGRIAHRALHGPGRPENSRAAIRAAMARGLACELDLQLSADGVAMVFHDDALDRLTGEAGPVRARGAAELGRIPLLGGQEGVPTLREVLALVAGAVPLLLEIKDQDGAMGPDVGPLERAVAADLAGHAGAVAVMSFNPHSVAAFGRAAPGVPRGLVTAAFGAGEWPDLPAATRDRLRRMADLEAAGASFVSHEAAALGMAEVARARAAGLGVLCWTVRSAKAEREALRVADAVTFEGYLPG
jgi:glycerophosphoryl diester phosphodiesterase